MFNRMLVLAAAAAVAVGATSVASAATTPEVRSLQRQVKALTAQVKALRTELNALKGTVGNVATKADEAAAAAAGAGQAAAGAVAKTNCLVSAAPLVVWSNDVYHVGGGELGVGTGLDLSAPSDPVSVFVGAINSSCVPSVFPRVGQSAFAPRYGQFALLRHPH